MSLDRVPAGADVPHEINVIVEVPLRSDPVKYEVDKDTAAVFVDRFLNTAMHYPCNYGYIPQTLYDDGDPLDVLVVTPVPLIPGAVVCCRPVAVLNMIDEKGRDDKILAVPVDRLCGLYRHVLEPADLPAILLDQIKHFFAHYKDLEPNKWVRVEGWRDSTAAKAEICRSLGLYRGAAHRGSKAQ